MGTNFYFHYESGLERHIGKMFAIGSYCWDCGKTLSGTPYQVPMEELLQCKPRPHRASFRACPSCDKELSRQLMPSVASERLGVTPANGFIWAIDPGFFISHAIEGVQEGVVIKDEYQQPYTLAEFFLQLERCPIRLYGSIGTEFD